MEQDCNRRGGGARRLAHTVRSGTRAGARGGPRYLHGMEAANGEERGLTVGKHICHLLDLAQVPSHVPDWPPDCFALAMSLLHRSGAYVMLLGDWPPDVVGPAWTTQMAQVGREWRQYAGRASSSPGGASAAEGVTPADVQAWWEVVVALADRPVGTIRSEASLWRALVQIVAAADEACAGVGFPTPPGESIDPLLLDLEYSLRMQEDGTTLCRAVSDTMLRVLPKAHTPQSGATLRSLSHHLALVHHTDVRPWWHAVPADVPRHGLNLLLVPYPYEVRPASFSEVDGPLRNMPQQFGFFRYLPPRAADAASVARRCVDRATELVGAVHGVVFPELALDSDACDEVALLCRQRGILMVAGVRRTGETGEGPTGATLDDENLARVQVSGARSDHLITEFDQHKHHRWKLDRNQIVQYGLGGRLDIGRSWWEATALRERTLQFIALDSRLSMCVLICEDLARQDPVAQLVRAVGPNLVIALLMDGPQTGGRWPARYATVFADDPGCSVLTLTSSGMMRLSRPPAGVVRSKAVALWRDPTGGTTEIELPEGASAIVLSLAREREVEWTADGREHVTEGGRLVLAGCHPVYISNS